MKITGFDKLQREIADAQKAIALLEDSIGSVRFDPADPGSIDAAITAMESMVDERLGDYAKNAIIGPLIPQMKESYRQAIIDKAAEARLGAENANE